MKKPKFFHPPYWYTPPMGWLHERFVHGRIEFDPSYEVMEFHMDEDGNQVIDEAKWVGNTLVIREIKDDNQKSKN